VDLETGEVAIEAIEEAAVIGEEEEDKLKFRGFGERSAPKVRLRTLGFKSGLVGLGIRIHYSLFDQLNDSTLIIQQLIIDYVTAKKIEA
jgi:hypothetical protein